MDRLRKAMGIASCESPFGLHGRASKVAHETNAKEIKNVYSASNNDVVDLTLIDDGEVCLSRSRRLRKAV